MTWTAGTSRASYDYVGSWNIVVDLGVDAPDAVMGDASSPGAAVPGTFSLGESYTTLRFTLEALT